jgi:16S rRNA processing protein RimM
MGELNWIPIARVARPHGLKGWIKLYPYGETLSGMGPGDELYVGDAPDKEKQRLTVLSLRPQGKLWLGQFRELTNRNEAEELKGKEFFVTEDLLSPTTEGEYYHYQLIGLLVLDENGWTIGTVREVLETGSHDVYTVEGADGQEVLIPAVEEIVVEIDVESGTMTVDLPKGLMNAL